MREFEVTIPQEFRLQIKALIETDSDNFLSLVENAKLDKRHAFIGMAFDGMDLDGLELNDFDFSNADFRGCSLSGTTFIDCNLEGAAFSLPPNVRDRWRGKQDFILADEADQTVELMRIAANASRQELRKEALKNLLPHRSRHGVKQFLKKTCSDDKSKGLRSWLRRQISESGKNSAELLLILERSLFSGREEPHLDVLEYLNLAGKTRESIAVVCQACVTNSRIIAAAADALTDDEAFKQTLLSNVAHSEIGQVWIESGFALRKFKIDAQQKLDAFAQRLFQIESTYDLKHLAEIAAYNELRVLEIFNSCEIGYKQEKKESDADDFLLYCYFYSPEKYQSDVLYHCFADDNLTSWGTFAVTAFGAYCFVHHRSLYLAVVDQARYFYLDPRTLIGLKEDFFSYRDEKPLEETRQQLRSIAQQLFEQFKANPEMKVLRR